MSCGLCANDAQEVVIEESGRRVVLPICDDCLLSTDEFTLTDFLQSKFDVMLH